MTRTSVFVIAAMLMAMTSLSSARSFRPEDIETFPHDDVDTGKRFREAKSIEFEPEIDEQEEGGPMGPDFENPDTSDDEDTESNEGDSEEGIEDGDRFNPHLGGDDNFKRMGGRPDKEKESGFGDIRGFKPDLGFLFGNPILSLNLMNEYFHRLENALQKAFQESLADAVNDPNSFTNTTSEIVDINGQKYHVQKTLVKNGDEKSSVVIKTVISKPIHNETDVEE